MTLDKVIALAAGLRELNQYEKVIGNGERSNVVRVSYDFSEATAWAIARNMGAVGVVMEMYNKRKNEIIGRFDQGTGTVNPAQMADFLKAHNELIAVEEDVSLMKIKAADLKVGKNPIPPSVLVAISPMIEDG